MCKFQTHSAVAECPALEISKLKLNENPRRERKLLGGNLFCEKFAGEKMILMKTKITSEEVTGMVY
jgi:hypothetical protein